MKVLVISDTHGNLTAIKHVLGFAKRQKVDAVIHCGDWCDEQSVKAVLEYNLPLYTVLGNCDEAHKEEVWSALAAANRGEDTLGLELGGRKIAIAHEPWKLDEHRISGKFDALFYGHFHNQAGSKTYGDTLVANPGALGNTTKPSFAVYKTSSNTAELIEIPI